MELARRVLAEAFAFLFLLRLVLRPYFFAGVIPSPSFLLSTNLSFSERPFQLKELPLTHFLSPLLILLYLFVVRLY